MEQHLVWFIVQVIIVWCALTCRRNDQNVWGIYLENKKLNVGDFWLAVAVIYAAYQSSINLIFFIKL